MIRSFDRFRVGLLFLVSAASCGRTSDLGVRADRVSIPSPSLAGSLLPNSPDQPALVLLPPSYASSSRAYPVIYFLPGFTTDITEYLDGTFEGFDLRRTLAERVEQGLLPFLTRHGMPAPEPR